MENELKQAIDELKINTDLFVELSHIHMNIPGYPHRRVQRAFRLARTVREYAWIAVVKNEPFQATLEFIRAVRIGQMVAREVGDEGNRIYVTSARDFLRAVSIGDINQTPDGIEIAGWWAYRYVNKNVSLAYLCI